jgi:hypothetical protein
MNEKLIEICNKLKKCIKNPNGRIYYSANELGELQSVLCFMLVGDTYKNLAELKKAVQDCLIDTPFSIDEINSGTLSIMPVLK